MGENQEREAEGVTRRDALKLGGLAALGGAAAALASSAVEAGTAGATTSPPAHIPTSLRVTVDGQALPGIRSMEVISALYQSASSTDSTGQWVSAPTGLDQQDVTLTRYFTGDQAFLNLFQEQNGGTARRKDVVITVLGRKGSIANTFTLSNCFAVGWTGPVYDAKLMAKGGSADRVEEKITIRAETLKIQ